MYAEKRFGRPTCQRTGIPRHGIIQDMNIMNKLTLDLNTSTETKLLKIGSVLPSDDDGRKVDLTMCAGRQPLISEKDDLLHVRKNDVIPLLECEYTLPRASTIRGMFYNLAYNGVISNTTEYYEGHITTLTDFNVATQEDIIAWA